MIVAVSFLGAALLLGAVLSACSGSSASTKEGEAPGLAQGAPPSASDGGASGPAAVSSRGSAAPASGAAQPGAPASAFKSALPRDASPQLRRGEVLFQVEAGGAGCQMCHGRDGKGLVGPNIRSKTAVDIEDAIQTRELMINAIGYLPADDIEAVAAYLSYLADQP